MKQILVTGGAGFIGSHLSRALAKAGHHVTALDNFLTGHRHNIEDLLNAPNFTFIYHDITEPASPLLAGNYHEIYNLACPASPFHYQQNPVQTVMINVVGTEHMLQLARRCGARFLQASTSEVYGNPLTHPQAESYSGNVNPISERACYDEGKRCAETLVFDYHRHYGVPVKLARIFNTYGPYMRRNDGRVVSNLICQALAGEALTVYGDGLQTRSFCYIDDMVDGLIRLMESGETVTGPVNLGNPEEFTIEELAGKILELTKRDLPLRFKPLPQDDPRQRQPDIALAEALLGWRPATSLERGLHKTIGYFAQLPANVV